MASRRDIRGPITRRIQSGDCKKFLAAQDPPGTKKQLQAQLDFFAEYYNEVVRIGA